MIRADSVVLTIHVEFNRKKQEKCLGLKVEWLTRGSKLWETKTYSRIVQAQGMETNQGELARPHSEI